MASNVINRYVWLLNTLLQQKTLSLREISELWQKSGLGDNKPLARRTFQMHRNAIEELFNICINYDSASNSYYIEDADKFRISRTCRWLLESFSVANLIQAGANMENRILFEEVPGGIDHIEKVVRAMQQEKILHIDYQQFGKEPKELYFRPYALKIYNRRWYIVGRASDGGRIVNIALDRVRVMELTNLRFTPPEDFDAKSFYAHSIGIYVDESIKPQFVKVRVRGVMREYLRALPMHHSQEECATTNEYSDFRYYLSLTPELSSHLLTMGECAEVLEPQALREQMRERASKIAKLYK